MVNMKITKVTNLGGACIQFRNKMINQRSQPVTLFWSEHLLENSLLLWPIKVEVEAPFLEVRLQLVAVSNVPISWIFALPLISIATMSRHCLAVPTALLFLFALIQGCLAAGGDDEPHNLCTSLTKYKPKQAFLWFNIGMNHDGRLSRHRPTLLF